MAQTFALQPLLELAQAEGDAAKTTLATLNREIKLQDQKLVLLLNYREEYQERLRQRVTTGLDGGGLRNFNDFLDRLEQAVTKQQAVVVHAQARADAALKEWQIIQRKFKAFDKLSQRFDSSLRCREAKRDQKVQDDNASRRAIANAQRR